MKLPSFPASSNEINYLKSFIIIKKKSKLHPDDDGERFIVAALLTFILRRLVKLGAAAFVLDESNNEQWRAAALARL